MTSGCVMFTRMYNFLRILTVTVASALICPIAMAATQVEKQAMEIGHIDFFGYGGVNLQSVKDHLPIKIGDLVTYETFDRDKGTIRAAIQEVTGRPSTDIAAVCCDNAQRLLVYIGLGGTSSHAPLYNAVRHGSERLDPKVVKLYQEMEDALVKAVKSGGREDWSKGYALSVDPKLRAIQLKIRAYALNREAEFEKVLQNSADEKQRIVSAEMLGYVKRSQTQVQALAGAANDSNGTVRNNAIRALGVLFAAKDTAPLKLDTKPFVELLFSEKWTDRNKASLLLVNLTRQRDPATLDDLRKNALDPLIEGARWSSSSGHDGFFLQILGRIGGLPDEQIEALIKSGDKEKIIRAAEKR